MSVGNHFLLFFISAQTVSVVVFVSFSDDELSSTTQVAAADMTRVDCPTLGFPLFFSSFLANSNGTFDIEKNDALSRRHVMGLDPFRLVREKANRVEQPHESVHVLLFVVSRPPSSPSPEQSDSDG